MGSIGICQIGWGWGDVTPMGFFKSYVWLLLKYNNNANPMYTFIDSVLNASSDISINHLPQIWLTAFLEQQNCL